MCASSSYWRSPRGSWLSCWLLYLLGGLVDKCHPSKETIKAIPPFATGRRIPSGTPMEGSAAPGNENLLY